MTALLQTSKVMYGDIPAPGLHQDTDVWPPPVRAFTPDQVPSLLLWYDATQDTANDGDAMNSWTDRSGNAFLAGINSGAVTYTKSAINGQPALRFGAASISSFRTTQSHTVTNRTIFQVLKRMGNPVGPYHTTQIQELDPYLQTYSTPDNVITTYTNPGPLPSGVTWSGNGQLVISWCDSAIPAHWLEVDGHQVSAAWTPAASNSPFHVGGFVPGGYGFNGYIGEMLIYERCLTAIERQNVQSYLKTKWSLP